MGLSGVRFAMVVVMAVRVVGKLCGGRELHERLCDDRKWGVDYMGGGTGYMGGYVVIVRGVHDGCGGRG